MNTKLITFASSLLAVGALVLSYGVGCGDDDDVFMTNAPAANTASTNVAATNVAATNVAATNVAATNVAATNVAATNVAATNTGTTNVAGLGSNYIDDGTIKGYCFGFYKVGGVQTDCNVETELCCAYSLPGTSWDDIAMVGCNVNQDSAGGDGSELTWTPPALSSQICIDGGGFTRLQIQGPNGADDSNDRWCATGTGCIAFSEFNTECWEGGNGTAYAGQPLQAVAALMPSLSDGETVATNPVSDTLCVSSISVVP
jgi:hypothetical protein